MLINLKKYQKMQNILEINTKKQIILYGAQNPQSKRKGWDLFLDAKKN